MIKNPRPRHRGWVLAAVLMAISLASMVAPLLLVSATVGCGSGKDCSKATSSFDACAACLNGGGGCPASAPGHPSFTFQIDRVCRCD